MARQRELEENAVDGFVDVQRRKQRLDLVHEVKQLVEQLRIVPRSPIFIDFTEGNDKLVVAGDLSRLRRVWQNIIRNAMDAAETGKKEERPRLMITVKRTGKFARLQFRDNAGGIPRQRLVRVFEPFFTTKDVGRGTGLGLAISKEFIEAQSGNITVDSEFGAGSTFTLTLNKAT